VADEKSYPKTEAQRATDDWNPVWDLMEDMDPDYLEAFLAFRFVPQTCAANEWPAGAEI